MPTKTKKPTLKSKSTKKSPSKLDKVIKKLNLARPRNQFIVAFLVVGILGGGYFAYQSFANTITYSFNPSNNTLICYVETCSRVSDTGISKNPTQVLKFNSESGYGKASTTAKTYAGNTYQTCIIAKVSTYTAFGLTPYPYLPNGIGAAVMEPGNAYQKACTNIWTEKITGYKEVSLTFRNSSPPTYVEQMTIESVPVAPTPTK